MSLEKWRLKRIVRGVADIVSPIFPGHKVREMKKQIALGFLDFQGNSYDITLTDMATILEAPDRHIFMKSVRSLQNDGIVNKAQKEHSYWVDYSPLRKKYF